MTGKRACRRSDGPRSTSPPITTAIFVALTLASTLTNAKGRSRVLLQAYAERIPEDGLHYVNYLVRTLGAQAPEYGRVLRALIDAKLSRDAGGHTGSDALRQLVEVGSQQFIEGEYAKAIDTLQRARQRMLARQYLLAVDQTLRDVLHRATLFLAHAYLRSGDPETAGALVAETIRSFPDREVSLVHHGPDLVRLYKRQQRTLRHQQRGSLSVNTEPSGCMVFVNERYLGLAPAHLGELYPGEYRVFVQRPNDPGRVHQVQVSGADRTLTIDFALDRALQTTPEVLLLYPTRAAKKKLAVSHAAVIGRRLGVDEIILLDIRRYQGRRVLQGRTIESPAATVVRSGLIAIEPETPAPQQLKALGHFLLDGIRNKAVTVVGPKRTTAPQRSGLWRWVTMGVGLAAVGAGIPLLAIHDSGTCGATNCPKTYNTLAPGIALTVGGAAVLVGSAVLFVLHARDGAPKPSAPGGASSTMLQPWLTPRAVGLNADWHF